MGNIILSLQFTAWLREGTAAEGCYQRMNVKKRQVDLAWLPPQRKFRIQHPLRTAFLKMECSTSTQHSTARYHVPKKVSASANSPAPKKKAALEIASVAQTSTATNASLMNTVLGSSFVVQTRTATNASVMNTAPGNLSVALTSTAGRKVVRCFVMICERR